MRVHPVPKVGDTVVFNGWGLRQCFGSAEGLAHMKTMEMKITSIDMNSLTAPDPTYSVSVDNRDIDRFLIDHNDFDIVRRA